MRFGIMAMQMSALVPPPEAMKNPLAFIAGFDHAALIRRVASSGFKMVELNSDLALFFPQSFTPEAIDQVAAVKRELGLTFTMHLPIWSVDSSTMLQPVREGSQRALIQAVQATLPLEPERYVLHPVGALASEFNRMSIPENAKALVLRQFQTNGKQTVKTLLAETGLSSRRLAIETVEFPFALTLEMALELNTLMCLDTGHVLSGQAGPVNFFDALETVLPLLGEVHLHDAPLQKPGAKYEYNRDHQALGKGDLEVARLLDRLAQAGWDGPIIFELSPDEARQSLEVIRANRPQYVPAGE